MFKYHVLALLLGSILDFFLGRIYSIWNPFDSVKSLIKYLDRALLGDEIILLEPAKQKSLGLWLVMIVIMPVFVVSAFFTMLCYDIAIPVGILFEAFATYLCIETRYIYNSGKIIMEDFYGDGIDAMKYSYEIFSGKLSEGQDEEQVTKETITFIANETSDWILSPMLVMFLFGPVGGFVYRTIDMIDKAIGYKTYRYNHFGYAAATLNRIIDYIPSRFSGVVTVFVAKYILPGVNGKNAKYINIRDRFKAVSAFSGALEMKLKNDLVGDDDKEAAPSDIKRAISLELCDFVFIQCFLVILLLFF